MASDPDDLIKRAHALVERITNLDSAGRERELQRLCSSDPSLARAVRGRLRARALAGEIMATEPVEVTSPEHEWCTAVQSNEQPHQLGRFRIIRELGRGGMGIVYEAEQELPHRRVALKTLPRGHSLQARAQFRVEVDATARVVHPGIPQVYEVFFDDDRPVLVMELIEGLELREAVHELGRERRIEILRDAALAVDAAHERGVVHRDLKPSNVLVTTTGQVKVLDFGVAALGDRIHTRGAFTLSFAAPEQLAGDAVDRRCDVYGLGAIALEVLTGRLVADPGHLSMGQLLTRKTSAIEPPLELPSALAAILVRALAAKPDDRYPSARAFADELDRYLRWRPVEAFEGGLQDTACRRFELRRVALSPPLGGLQFEQRELATGKLTGSLRAIELDRHPNFAGPREWLGVEVPAELVALSRVIDEVTIAPDARGTDAMTAVIAAAFEHTLGADTLLSFSACTPARYPEYIRLGFRAVGRVKVIAGLGHVVPMVLIHHDLEHLVRVGSPLSAVLRTHGHFGDERGLAWMRAFVSLGLASAASASLTLDEHRWDSALLSGLSAQGRAELIHNSTRRPGSPGDELIGVGELGHWMAIVDAGLVEIVVDDAVIAVRGPGELIGEMGFLLDKPRTARAVVASPGTSLTILSPEAISQLSDPHDREQLWRNLAVILARKLEVQTRAMAPLRRGG